MDTAPTPDRRIRSSPSSKAVILNGRDAELNTQTPPVRVLIVTAPIDAHNEYVCAGVFLERLARDGHVSIARISYEAAVESELQGTDLILLIRPRYAEVPILLERARRADLPLLVVIDDNWIAAGREYPRFEALFTPGRPALESFLGAVRAADAVLVFTAPMEHDLQKYGRIVHVPSMADLDAFAAVPPGRSSGPHVVGYAGSERWELSGFRGLRDFLERHAETRLLIISHDIPTSLRDVPRERVTFIPWQPSYQAYARALRAEAPDVLVAPLDDTRAAASKTPRKFLDHAAAGVAGIYSRVAPYTDVVEHGVTGLLVENDAAAWTAALEQLYGDPTLRARLATAALERVRATASLEITTPYFAAMISEVVQRRRRTVV